MVQYVPVVIEEIEEIKLNPVAIDTEVLCNCYLGAETYASVDLPPMYTLTPNVTKPEVGDIAIMMYQTVKHVAVVTAVSTSTFSTRESNYRHCEETERVLNYNYRRLVGFYRP